MTYAALATALSILPVAQPIALKVTDCATSMGPAYAVPPAQVAGVPSVV